MESSACVSNASECGDGWTKSTVAALLSNEADSSPTNHINSIGESVSSASDSDPLSQCQSSEAEFPSPQKLVSETAKSLYCLSLNEEIDTHVSASGRVALNSHEDCEEEAAGSCTMGCNNCTVPKTASSSFKSPSRNCHGDCVTALCTADDSEDIDGGRFLSENGHCSLTETDDIASETEDGSVVQRPITNPVVKRRCRHATTDSATSTQDYTLSSCDVIFSDGIEYRPYSCEQHLNDIMELVSRDLSEPYSIYTYRYFIYNWPNLCFRALDVDRCVGAIVCKLNIYHDSLIRGYIAMLAVDKQYRRRHIGTQLVLCAIKAMMDDNCDDVVLEAEIDNPAALRLYENLGFIRDKRLHKYYLNGNDAFRLRLLLD